MWLDGSCFVLSSVAPDGWWESAVVRQAVYENQSVRSVRTGRKACVLLQIFAVWL